MNITKHQAKVIEALRPIEHGRLRLDGPPFEEYNPDTGESRGRVTKRYFTNSIEGQRERHAYNIYEGGSRPMRQCGPGGRAEVDQEIARVLVYEQSVAKLVEGSHAFSVFDEPDGVPFVTRWWYPDNFFPRFNPVFADKETIEILSDNFGIQGPWIIPKGERIKVDKYFLGPGPLSNWLWLDDDRRTRADGAPFPFRICRPSPEPAKMAIGALKMDSAIRKMWSKLFPDDEPPLPGQEPPPHPA